MTNPAQSGSEKQPTEEAQVIGRYLAKYPPPFAGDRWNEHGWAIIADAVWAAEDALGEESLEADLARQGNL